MGAVGIIMIGVGCFMIYEAVKSSNPTPVVTAKAVLKQAAPKATTTG